MIVTPRGCSGECELGLAVCAGQWHPQYCVLQHGGKRDAAQWRAFLREQSEAGLAYAPEGFNGPPQPYDPDSDPESPGWHEMAWRADACEFRKAVDGAGCCGQQWRCVGGPRDGKIAEPISLCIGCQREQERSKMTDGASRALQVMVPPSQRRQRIWRGGILQIHVTRACDLACFGCSQGSNLAGKPVMMTPDQFDEACASLDGYFGVVGVFGGNPAISPHFEEYCRIMRARFPLEQRGLWCNHPRGKGKLCAITFYPPHSNLNVHLSQEAYDEFARDWPECRPHLKGLADDSIHGSPWVAMKDLIHDESRRWQLIADCDINKHWSAMICLVRGELRGFFCEIAGAQAMLHADNPDWDGTGQPMPDTGVKIEPRWWDQPMSAFEAQVRTHCHNCAIPLRRTGERAINGSIERFSETHRHIARPKVRDRTVELVTIGGDTRPDRPSTEYLPGTTPKVH